MVWRKCCTYFFLNYEIWIHLKLTKKILLLYVAYLITKLSIMKLILKLKGQFNCIIFDSHILDVKQGILMEYKRIFKNKNWWVRACTQYFKIKQTN